jgi:Family of unknown function (DUF6683)
MRFTTAAFMVALVLQPSSQAGAQMFSPDYGTMGAPMSSFLANSYLTQQVVNDTTFHSSIESGNQPAVPADAADLTFKASGESSSAVEAFSESYPEEHRAQARQVFEELLARYGQVEQQFGLESRDLASAAAAFVAGSYMGYRNADFPDAHFRPLVEQMRAILSRSPEIAAASDAQKQDMYERLVVLGMFMAATQMALKSQPDATVAANMHDAAGGYLKQFLQTDPDRVVIGPQGLSVK